MDFGYFRLVDYLHREYNFGFNIISFTDVIDSVTSQLDIDLTAEKLAERSKTVSKSELLEQVEMLREEFLPSIALCRGKDVLSIMAFLLSSDGNLSDKVKIQTRTNELYRTLRMAYEFAYFISTALYKRIRKWETENTPFRIIKDFPFERTS